MVLQTKSQDTWYRDVGPGQAGTSAPAMPNPPHCRRAGGCTPLWTLSFSARALHSPGRGDSGAHTPSHLFLSCVERGYFWFTASSLRPVSVSGT